MKNTLILLCLLTLLACTNTPETPLPAPPEGNALFHPFNEIIQFDQLKSSDFGDATEYIVAKCDLWVERIYNTDDRDFDNTLLEIDNLYNELTQIYATTYLMGYTHPDSAIRESALASIMDLEEYVNNLSLNDSLYQSVKEYSQTS